MSKITATPEELSPCHYALAIEIPAEAVDRTISEVEKTFLTHAPIPGFRPGKAPVRLLRRRFAKRIQEESRERLIREGLQEGLRDLDIEPLTMPTFMPGKEGTLSQGEAFVFSVEFDSKPQFEIPDYEGMELERPVMDVDDEAVDRYLNQMREQRATFQPVERATRHGDLVKAAYTSDLAEADDLPEEAERLVRTEETWLILDEPEMIPGIATGLVEMEAGQEKELEVTFPSDFHVDWLQERTGNYTFTILEVQGREAPELNDEFAQMLGAEDLESMREQIRQGMGRQVEQMQAEALESQATAKLVEMLDFPVPPQAFERETESQFRRMMYQRWQEEEQRRRAGQESEQEELSEEERETAMRAQAAERAMGNLRLRYVLDAVADDLDLTVDDAAVQAEVERFRNNLRLNPKQFERQYDVDVVTASCRQDLLRQAAMDHIVEKAQIKDVSAGDADTAEEAGAEAGEDQPGTAEE